MKRESLAERVKEEAVKVSGAWSDSDASIHGAAVAYYTIFAIAPLLLIAIAVAGFFLDQSYVQAGLESQLRAAVGPDAAAMVQTLVASRQLTGHSYLFSAVSLLFILIGAAGIFSTLESALDAIFENLPDKKIKGIWKVISKELVSFGMVFAVGFVLLASLVASTVLASFGRLIDYYVPGGAFVSYLFDFGVSFALISLFMGGMIKFLPTKRVAWRPALWGGLIAGALFTAGKYVLGFYFSHFGSTSVYGAASSLILIILWVYYLSQAFFLSAILTKIHFIKK